VAGQEAVAGQEEVAAVVAVAGQEEVAAVVAVAEEAGVLSAGRAGLHRLGRGLQRTLLLEDHQDREGR
jgi:FAD/FMN-containing dehydrogenase